MKNLIAGLVTALMALALTAPALALGPDGEFTIPSAPTGPGNSAPDVYLALRAVDIGIDVDGSGSSINPSDIRPGFYAFTGERIYYYVLVRDQNGADDINLVYWAKDDAAEMGPCSELAVDVDEETWLPPHFHAFDPIYEQCIDDTSDGGVNGDLVHPHCGVWIEEATNLLYDSQTDKVYVCILTVESEWEGSEIQVVAEDTYGDSGATVAENWDFNPPLMVDVDTSDGCDVTFGDPVLDQSVPGITEPNCVRDMMEDLDPNGVDRICANYDLAGMKPGAKLCDVSFSENKVVIENIGPPVTLWTFIAATNFYDSTGMAKCPFTNELAANQFEYRAMTGSWDSGWRVMPQYAPSMDCSGPTLMDSCRGGCRISTGCPLDVLPPGNHIEVALKIVWPTPCIGTFDTGDIVVIIRAI